MITTINKTLLKLVKSNNKQLVIKFLNAVHNYHHFMLKILKPVQLNLLQLLWKALIVAAQKSRYLHVTYMHKYDLTKIVTYKIIKTRTVNWSCFMRQIHTRQGKIYKIMIKISKRTIESSWNEKQHLKYSKYLPEVKVTREVHILKHLHISAKCHQITETLYHMTDL